MKGVLVTGACGFIGKYTIASLVEDFFLSTSYEKRIYSHIIALDFLPTEQIVNLVCHSSCVVPLSLNLSNVTVDSFKFLENISCVIHIAGIVDTRESAPIRQALETVNVNATRLIVEASKKFGVSRIIYLSSASAGMFQDPTFSKLPFSLLPNTLFSNLTHSTYGHSKLQAENIVLNACSETLSTLALRPHVVWGRGDPLSTELLINWPRAIPHVIFGDTNATVVPIRADNVARFLLLSDTALRVSREGVRGRTWDIGDCTQSSLQFFSDMIATQHKRHFSSTSSSTSSPRLRYVVIPPLLAFLLVLSSQLIDWWFKGKKNWHFLRLLSPNNLAYTMKGVVSLPHLNTYQTHCQTLLLHSGWGKTQGIASEGSGDHQLGSFSAEHLYQDWRASLPSNHFALSSSFLSDRFRRIRERQSELLGEGLSAKFHAPLPPDNLLGQPTQIGPITLRNKVIKAATFECMCDSRGVPTDELIAYHRRGAEGGAGLNIVAYGGVSIEGRSFSTQICLRSPDPKVRSETEGQLGKLVQAVHEVGGKVGLQLTHSGAFADSRVNFGLPAVGPSRIFNPLTLKFSQSLDGDESALARIEEDFVQAALLCRRLGFDAVELHLGHGYLLSQFLSTCTNQKYASDPQTRLRFPLQVLKRVVSVAHSLDSSMPGKPMAVLVKFNVSEATEADLPISHARYFARAFYEAGADLLVPSGGHVMTNGLHMLKGERPILEMAAAQRSTLKKLVISTLGWVLIPHEPYREAFFREKALSVLLGAGIPLSRVCLIGGVQQARTAEAAIRMDGFAAVQMGRSLLSDPDWPIKMNIFDPRQILPSSIQPNNPATNETETDSEPLPLPLVPLTSDSQDVSRTWEGVSVGGRQGQELRDWLARPLSPCDQCNRCIVGATMSLTPLRCESRPQAMDW